MVAKRIKSALNTIRRKNNYYSRKVLSEIRQKNILIYSKKDVPLRYIKHVADNCAYKSQGCEYCKKFENKTPRQIKKEMEDRCIQLYEKNIIVVNAAKPVESIATDIVYYTGIMSNNCINDYKVDSKYNTMSGLEYMYGYEKDRLRMNKLNKIENEVDEYMKETFPE